MNDELKSCPFCGYSGNIVQFLCSRDLRHIPGYTFYFIRCPQCGIRTEEYQKKNKAITDWNRRIGILERFSKWLSGE